MGSRCNGKGLKKWGPLRQQMDCPHFIRQVFDPLERSVDISPTDILRRWKIGGYFLYWTCMIRSLIRKTATGSRLKHGGLSLVRICPMASGIRSPCMHRVENVFWVMTTPMLSRCKARSIRVSAYRLTISIDMWLTKASLTSSKTHTSFCQIFLPKLIRF